MKKKKIEIEALVKKLDTDADNFLSQANSSDDLGKMRKTDSFKMSAKEKKKAVDEYCSTIEKMGEEMTPIKKVIFGRLDEFLWFVFFHLIFIVKISFFQTFNVMYV